MMQLMPLDLPAPVAPAISRCGVDDRSMNTARPAMSLPTATSSGWVAWPPPRRTAMQIAERDELTMMIGDLDTDRRATGDRRQDADIGGGHRVRDVFLEAGDLSDLDARPELEFVPGHRRPDGHADQFGLDVVLGERLLERLAAPLDLGHVDRLLPGLLQVS